MSRELCNECLAKQARDGKLSVAERERLVHRRRVNSDVEHFRRDCRWWPKDGTAFHQRGIDFRTRVGEAGASHIYMLWGAVSAVLVSMWAQGILLAQTAVNIDVALILTAATPLIVAVGAIIQVFLARKAKAVAEGTYVLVDGQMTREKENRLFEMQVSRSTLSSLAQGNPTPEVQATLEGLDQRIGALQAEIEARIETVATIPATAKP